MSLFVQDIENPMIACFPPSQSHVSLPMNPSVDVLAGYKYNGCCYMLSHA